MEQAELFVAQEESIAEEKTENGVQQNQPSLTLHTVLHGRAQSWVSMTVRGDALPETLDKMVELITYAGKYGLRPIREDGQQVPPGMPKQQPVQEVPEPNPVPQSPEPSDAADGSGRLLKIHADPATGGIMFYVEGLRYPLTDKRGSSVVAKLFIPNWPESKLRPGSYYDFTLPGSESYFLYWKKVVKNGKTYYNIMSVQREEAA